MIKSLKLYFVQFGGWAPDRNGGATQNETDVQHDRLRPVPFSLEHWSVLLTLPSHWPLARLGRTASRCRCAVRAIAAWIAVQSVSQSLSRLLS